MKCCNSLFYNVQPLLLPTMYVCSFTQNENRKPMSMTGRRVQIHIVVVMLVLLNHYSNIYHLRTVLYVCKVTQAWSERACRYLLAGNSCKYDTFPWCLCLTLLYIVWLTNVLHDNRRTVYILFHHQRNNSMLCYPEYVLLD